MPNWCEGNVRLRGTKENIKKFIENEIVYTVLDRDSKEFAYKEVKPNIEHTDWETFLTPPDSDCHDFYIRGTHRNFFFVSQLEICWPDAEPDEEIIICINDFNSAWSLKEQGWVEHARNYNIDIRLFGFEQGMEFSQILTIYKDGSIDEDVHEYNSYEKWMWECPFPNMGG